MKTYVFRLRPGQDIKTEIDAFTKKHGIAAGVLFTCVGNLRKVTIRMADEQFTKIYKGTFEIVSLVGTMENGYSHLHVSISDKDGNCFGGHLKSGSIVGITAEVVIGVLEQYTFSRELDKETGFKELVVNHNPSD